MKRHSLFLLFAAFLFVLAIPVPLSGQGGIVINKNAKQANPTLIFKGISGNETLSAKVLSDLLNCGWFDVIRSGNADYQISGTASGNQLTLTLSNGAGVSSGEFHASGSSVEDTAHEAVDAVLKNLFNIEGICRTKIIFTVATSSKTKEIYICDFDGHNVKALTRNGTLSLDPVWASDGKTMVYTFYGPTYTHLIQYDFSTKKSRRLTQYSGLNAGGAISPDGKYVALVLNRKNQVDLYLRPTEGSELKRLTNNRAAEASPCWSPDGTKLCFVSDVSGRPLLYLIDPFRGGSPKMITGIAGSERVTPSWSKDGKIAYSAKIGRTYTAAVAEVAPNGKAKMIDIGLPGSPAVSGEGPSWAPDNRHIVIGTNGKIFVVDTRLGKQRQLFNTGAKVSQPDWSPILR